ncbi:MAG: bifunctional oligoribonuclease/PAP phosphatase NrnA [Bacillales bacterium]|jgi:phosphoesterase RecJ-like protein|nr:bifunctional oligoribonuclease/PAP phosphatase NrnA [Bacillales bacterium]
MNYQKEIFKLVKEHNIITIFRHLKPDGDALGSQWGLYYLLKDNFPDKQIYAVGDTLNNFPNIIGKEEVVSDELIKKSLAIIIDVGDTPRVEGNFKIAKKIIKIDHHIFSEAFADIEYIDTSYGASALMVADLAFKEKLRFSTKSANCLLLGTLTDTGKFSFSLSSSLFYTVAKLIDLGADIKYLYDQLFSATPLEKVHFRGFLQCFFERTPNGVAYLKITSEILDKYHISGNDAATMVNALAGIQDIHIHVLFAQVENNKIRTEIRSKSININPIAVKYGGGGHKLASGALLDSFEIADLVLEDLDLLIKEHNE